jgi:hypothetical protein
MYHDRKIMFIIIAQVGAVKNICSSSCWSTMYHDRKIMFIIIARVGAVAAASEALRKRKRKVETEYTTKIDGFLLSFSPPLNANVLFCTFEKKISPCTIESHDSHTY